MTIPHGTRNRPALQPRQALVSARIISVIMTLGVAMLTFAMAVVSGGTEATGDYTHLLTGLLLVVAFALLGRRIATLGFVVPALRHDDPDPRATSMARLRTSTVYAAAIAEMGAVLWMAGSFVLHLELVQTLLPMALGVLGVLWASFPTDGRVRRLVDLLERDGVGSGLRELVP